MYYSIISWEDLNYDFNFDLFSYDWISIITIIVHLIWSETYPHIYLSVCLLHLVAEILDKSKILNTRWYWSNINFAQSLILYPYSNLYQKHKYNLLSQKNIKGKGEKEEYVISCTYVLLKNALSILLNMMQQG